MKIKNPQSRFHLSIKKNDNVLEVGGGHNPHPRSNVVVDKFIESNYHRNGDIKVLKHQKFLQADGENLPFKDKEFDYVICCQVLEHVPDPIKFLSEQFRVAKRGYIETPSLIGENLFPKKSHKWILHEIKNTLYLVEKESIEFSHFYNLGALIQDYLPKHSIGYKVMQRTHPNIETIRIEWEEDFKYVVNPDDPDVLKYFLNEWELEWKDQFFPPKSLTKEFMSAISAIMDISKSVFFSKLINRSISNNAKRQ